MLRWICELGCINILVDVVMLSHHLVAPHEGHLDQVFHIFAYIKWYNHSAMVFDDTKPTMDEGTFVECDWSQYYPGTQEPLPHDASEPRGKPILMTCYADWDPHFC